VCVSPSSIYALDDVPVHVAARRVAVDSRWSYPGNGKMAYAFISIFYVADVNIPAFTL